MNSNIFTAQQLILAGFSGALLIASFLNIDFGRYHYLTICFGDMVTPIK